MVAASGGQPVLAGLVLFKQNLRGDAQVAVWVQQLAGFLIAMLLITDIDLCQPGIDLGGLELLQRPLHGGAGGGAVGKALSLPGHVQRPGPGNVAALKVHAAFLQGDGVQHGDGDACLLCGQLVRGGRRGVGVCWCL